MAYRSVDDRSSESHASSPVTHRSRGPFMTKSIVVIAEGDDGLRRSVKELLRGQGSEVLETIDVLEVLRYVDCRTSGLVIAGVPTNATWNGLDVALAIRRKAAHIPVILIPGESS